MDLYFHEIRCVSVLVQIEKMLNECTVNIPNYRNSKHNLKAFAERIIIIGYFE